MKTNTAPDSDTDTDAGAESAGRPRNVDLALGAILLRCLLALAAAFALFGARPELRRNAATLHPEWSTATLVDKVDTELRSNVVLTIVYIGLVLLIAKYIRDGRNWARWLYTFVAFLVAGDVLRVAGFFTGDNLAFRLLSGLTGVAAVVAIVLLFLPSSSAYFRPAAGSTSPLRALFGGRAALIAAREAGGQPAVEAKAGVAAAEPVSLDKPSGPRAVRQRPAGTDRPPPRAKSRKQAAE
ncbi:MAG: hypothetical protein QOI26_896 [Pseudonocardiales bacterium]|jgi:hypothetical protein|nr:hypothetical protein [Pseudonocardiales bacterium]